MREIKFRAWNTVIGWWADNEPMTLSQLILNDCTGISEKGLNEDFTFMQFTGLTDKNGVEIYEGDIVSSKINCLFDEGIKNSVVTFRDGSFNYGDTNINFSMIMAFEIVVIGNIYENKELLGGY